MGTVHGHVLHAFFHRGSLESEEDGVSCLAIDRRHLYGRVLGEVFVDVGEVRSRLFRQRAREGSAVCGRPQTKHRVHSRDVLMRDTVRGRHQGTAVRGSARVLSPGQRQRTSCPPGTDTDSAGVPGSETTKETDG